MRLLSQFDQVQEQIKKYKIMSKFNRGLIRSQTSNKLNKIKVIFGDIDWGAHFTTHNFVDDPPSNIKKERTKVVNKKHFSGLNKQPKIKWFGATLNKHKAVVAPVRNEASPESLQADPSTSLRHKISMQNLWEHKQGVD